MKIYFFLHRFIRNLSTVVSYLAIIALLPQCILAPIIYFPLLSPPIITMAVLAVSLLLSLPPTPQKRQPKLSQWQHWTLYQSMNNLLASYKKSRFCHLVFGASKGLQSLTVIRYIRASMSLRRTIKTPIIAFIIACLSTISSLKQPDSQTAHITRETISFVLDAATSIGFLYLLNYSSPWSLPILALSLILLTTLSISVEYKLFNHSYLSAKQKISHPPNEQRSASYFKYRDHRKPPQTPPPFESNNSIVGGIFGYLCRKNTA